MGKKVYFSRIMAFFVDWDINHDCNGLNLMSRQIHGGRNSVSLVPILRIVITLNVGLY